MPLQEQAEVVHAAQYRGFVAIVLDVEPSADADAWQRDNCFTSLAKTMASVEVNDDFQWAPGDLATGFYPTRRAAMLAIQMRVDEGLDN